MDGTLLFSCKRVCADVGNNGLKYDGVKLSLKLENDFIGRHSSSTCSLRANYMWKNAGFEEYIRISLRNYQ